MHSQQRRRVLAHAGRGLVALGLAGIAGYARTQSAERVIQIATRKFEFMPSEITLKKGEPVVLEFTAQDETMGFKLPAFGMRTDIVPGKVTQLRIVPEKAGKFSFFCDVFCGDGHEDMDGTLTVVE
ncbi:MAG TPA: cupredoxin domain-containing protein [Burkholderiales bacterium]|nr:cupredoxin domain-containing protein [Burkholderiales bacterium]